MELAQFCAEFGRGLLEAVRHQLPPVYDSNPDPQRDRVMDGLKRQPFAAQRNTVQAILRLLVDNGERAGIINAEMGTGKTMMAICTAAVMHAEGYRRILIVSPPHLVYKWRREIMETVPNARVWVLNGPDTLRKLCLLKASLGDDVPAQGPEFFILGRVRMRMGFHWRPACVFKHQSAVLQASQVSRSADHRKWAACSGCGQLVRDSDGNPCLQLSEERRQRCQNCDEPLWTLMHRGQGQQKNRDELVLEALKSLPTIGPKTAERLLKTFSGDVLAGMLADNVYEFINLMDEQGDLVFSDRQASRMERSLASAEFAFGQGGFQPTEYIKRHLPQHYFDLMIVDEGHEFKNQGSAQGQAFGVLCTKVRKTLLLTGTLMGGYADDIFFLLWRLMPERLMEDGFKYHRGSLGAAGMLFMRQHGVLKDTYTTVDEGSMKTAKGKKTVVRTQKAPGFGPLGIARFVLPFTAFLKLKDIGQNVLPPYQEHFVSVAMTESQEEKYRRLTQQLEDALKQALRGGDHSLLGVVLNCLLAWPDTCFRGENVVHPHSRKTLALITAETDPVLPKEAELLRLCQAEVARSRRVLVYTTYTGKRDTATRLCTQLKAVGLKPAVLRSTVDTDKREDWILEQVDKGCNVLICNPELVKTGLDLLEFPTIVFMQSGFNVYTLQQAARRSWRIGQKEAVDVYFLGYNGSAQMACLSLMAKKIAVAQSTSGDTPETGLDVLNQDGDSIEMALARQLIQE